MKKTLLLLPFILFFKPIIVGLILSVIHFATFDEKVQVKVSEVRSRNLVSSPIERYHSEDQGKINVLAAVGKGDSRPIIIDNFLAKHSSPLTGLGQVFVRAADEYGLDYRLLPAIAFQESTLGKRVPKGSHNPFGWAIYTGKNSGVSFRSWDQAIFSVAKGLRTDYIDRGLNTTEAIMTRYTPENDGSWAFGVNFAIKEMTPK